MTITGAVTEEALPGHLKWAPCIPIALCFLAPVTNQVPTQFSPTAITVFLFEKLFGVLRLLRNAASQILQD